MIDVSSADEQDVEGESGQSANPGANDAGVVANKNGTSPATGGDPLHGVYTQKDP